MRSLCVRKGSRVIWQRLSGDFLGHGESHLEGVHVTYIFPNISSSATQTLYLAAYPMMNVHTDSDIF